MMDDPTNISAKQIRYDIAQLQWANAMLRAANKAVSRGDVSALSRMGFSSDHIEELIKSGGFDVRTIRANYKTISYLRKQLLLKTSRASAHGKKDSVKTVEAVTS